MKKNIVSGSNGGTVMPNFSSPSQMAPEQSPSRENRLGVLPRLARVRTESMLYMKSRGNIIYPQRLMGHHKSGDVWSLECLTTAGRRQMATHGPLMVITGLFRASH